MYYSQRKRNFDATMGWRGKATGAGDVLYRVTGVIQILRAHILNAFRKTRLVHFSTPQLVLFLKCSHNVNSAVGLMRNISKFFFYFRKNL